MSLLTMRPLELGIHLLEIARNPSLLKDYGDYEDSFSSMRKVLLLSAKSSLLHSKDPLIRKSGNAMMDLALNAHLLDMHCRNLNRRMIRSTTNDEHILSRILMVNNELTCIMIDNNYYIRGEYLLTCLKNYVHWYWIRSIIWIANIYVL